MTTETPSTTLPSAQSRPQTAAFASGLTPTIACVNQASVDLGVEWPKLVAALAAYADIVAKVWGTPAHIVDGGRGPLPKGAWGLVFFDTADQPDALGYHDLTPEGLPLSKIFVETTIDDGEKVSVTAAHELVEMLVDPGIQMGALGADGQTWYAYETADAVEREEFPVEGVPMSSFVYPAWFEGFRAPRSVQFDYLEQCDRPFQLLAGGYISIFRNGQWSQVFGSEAARASFVRKLHPRTALRHKVQRQVSIHDLVHPHA